MLPPLPCALPPQPDALSRGVGLLPIVAVTPLAVSGPAPRPRPSLLRLRPRDRPSESITQVATEATEGESDVEEASLFEPYLGTTSFCSALLLSCCLRSHLQNSISAFKENHGSKQHKNAKLTLAAAASLAFFFSAAISSADFSGFLTSDAMRNTNIKGGRNYTCMVLIMELKRYTVFLLHLVWAWS